MAYVGGEKGAYIEELMNKSNDEFDKGNLDKSISLLEQAWDELPNNKVEYDESFLIVWGILDIAIILKDIKRMKKWVDKIFIADPERGDTGERELWAGKVAYEIGEFSKAKEYFDIAFKKSRGRCFGPKDSEYLKFYKSEEQNQKA
jgi:tetratricopeptide (TPR) repeat protein